VTFPTHALFVGAGFAVTAFPLVARMLQQHRVLATRQGRIALGAAVATAPLAYIIIATASASIRQQGVPGNVAVKVGLALALLVVLFGLARPLLRRLIARLFHPDEPLSDALLAVLVLGMLVSALAAHRIGIHAVAGGFLFGACIPYVDGFERAVLARLRHVTVAFGIPVFLGVIGLQTDFRVLDIGLLGGLVAFLAALVAGKLLVGAITGRAVGLGWQEGFTVGALLDIRGLMILVVAFIGLQSYVLAPMMVVAFVTAAIVTTLASGPLVSRLVPSETSEVRLEKTLARALAGIPQRSEGDRIVVAPVRPSSAPAAFAAALDHSAESPAPGFLLLDLPELEPDGEVVGAGPSEVRAAVLEGRSGLELGADALRTAGADVWVAVFQSPNPAADLARLSVEFGASAAIVGAAPEADAIADSGIKVERVGAAAR
jgi:Kef-type K+ transport system membrane component KefB